MDDWFNMWWVGFVAGGSVVHILHTLIGDWLKRTQGRPSDPHQKVG